MKSFKIFSKFVQILKQKEPEDSLSTLEILIRLRNDLSYKIKRS